MKRRIKLTESELKRMIAESVKRVIHESVISSTVANKLSQCSSNLKIALNTIQNDVIGLIDSLKDGNFSVYSKVMHNFIYSYPQMINDCYKPIIDEYIQSNTAVNKEGFDEPDDWYERNEHGDFDTY